MNYRLYSSMYQKVIKQKIPSLPINKTYYYAYYECFTLFILVLLIILYLWNNQFLYVSSKLHVIGNEICFNTFVTDTFIMKVIVCHGKAARTRVNAFLYASIIN